MKSIEDLFHALLQDIYFVQKHRVKSLAVWAGATADPALRDAFSRHRLETQEQLARLEQVFETIGRRARGRHYGAILGILAEAEGVIGRATLGSVRDAGILAAAQAAEHYEIARYGTLVALAERFNDRQVAQLLRRTLKEKKNANALLNKLAALSVNHAAQAA